MAKVTFHSAFLFFMLFLWLSASFAHGKCSYAHFGGPRSFAHDDLKRKKWINEQADHLEDSLLVKTLQYPSYASSSYELLLLDSNGNVYNDCVDRHSTRPGTDKAKLDDAHLNRIKQMLTHLNLTAGWRLIPEPKPDQQHTVLVFKDGKTFRRYDFNGELPAQVREVTDLLRSEMERQRKLP